jgi:hypothetical protein
VVVEGVDQRRQRMRVVGEVRVHFDEHLGSPIQAPSKAGSVGVTETLPLVPL